MKVALTALTYEVLTVPFDRSTGKKRGLGKHASKVRV